MVSHRHIVIGFQGSGKTTYAAALWYLVDSRSKQAPTVLSKGTHRGDYSYLERIADAWERGYQVERTGLGTWRSIAINLASPAVEGDIELSFVDMSGETFEQIFTSREYDSHIETMAQECEGLLLFVSADRKIDDATLVDIGKAFPEDMPDEGVDDEEDDELSEAVNFGGGAIDAVAFSSKAVGLDATETATVAGLEEPQPASGASAPIKSSDFTPVLTPRQVQIVDLLEAFSDAPIVLRPKRIAVVVSAWDLVGPDVTPQAWLAKSMPLLDQYLHSRKDEFKTRIYGVSAQGGRLPKRNQPDEGSDRLALLAEPVASRRIRVVGHNAGAHDLTHPIAWLSGLEP